VEKEIRVLVCEVGKNAYEKTIKNSLEEFQGLVNGLIEPFDLDNNLTIICNEEGKINGLPLNRSVKDEAEKIYEIIAGDFVVVGNSKDDFDSLSDEQLEIAMEKFKYPEEFYVGYGGLRAEKIINENTKKEDFIR
jgi:hypothetical protein